jgi:integrase
MTANPVSDGEMQVPTTETYRERELRTQIEKFMAAWGKYECIQRFARRHGKANTLRGYLADLDLYFRWLPTAGVTLTPDELVKDNLRCVYSSTPEEAQVKRRHTDYLDRYANVYLKDKGDGYSSRHRKVAAIRAFYHWNDSELFGAFSLSDGKAEQHKKTPSADDIREVLKALPIEKRTPLVLMWQTGAEPSAILSLRWGAQTILNSRGPDFASCQKTAVGSPRSCSQTWLASLHLGSVMNLSLWLWLKSSASLSDLFLPATAEWR